MKTVIGPRHLLGAASLAAFLFCGCGEGVEGYNVSGNVTFDGKPIPAGTIYFIPDSSKGNEGHTGYAIIENGTFDTSAEGGKPAVGGPMLVGIEGNDPNQRGEAAKDDTSGEVLVKSLFPYYETTAELPKEDTTMDFNVPADAVNRPGTSSKPVIIP